MYLCATRRMMRAAGAVCRLYRVSYPLAFAAAPDRLPRHIRHHTRHGTRAAAPGSLISVVGGRVSAANAGALTFPVLAASNESLLLVIKLLPAYGRELNRHFIGLFSFCKKTQSFYRGKLRCNSGRYH